MVILIPAALLILYLILYLGYEKGIRDAIIISTLALFLFIAVSNQLLSLIKGINYQGIVSIWIILNLFLLIWMVVRFRSHFEFNHNSMGKALARFGFLEWMLLAVIGIILITTLVIALTAPPNNTDSLVYHLARVMEWIRWESVEFFPTSITRQNTFPPLAEYAILHLQILSRSDQWANLIQWYSFIGSIVLVSLIAREIFLEPVYQVTAGFLAATLPMAILQSTSTQNDLVVSMFYLGFVYFLIQLTRENSPDKLFFASIALGLALLTKGTAYLYGAGMGIMIGGGSLLQVLKTGKKDQAKRLLISFTLVVLTALLLNSGMYAKNYQLYGNPLSNDNDHILNGQFSLRVLGTNIVRNLAVHLGVPFPEINQIITRLVENILGDYVNYAPATFEQSLFRVEFIIHEDAAGNLPQVIFIIFALITFLWIGVRKNTELIGRYLGGIVLSFLLYCFFIRWQPFASRLHLPLFLLSLPVVAWTFAQLRFFDKRILGVISLLLLIYSGPFLLLNSSRPLLENRSALGKRGYKVINLVEFYKYQNIFEASRNQMYFANSKDLYPDYLASTQFLLDKDVDSVGLYLGNNDWEYPFWVLLGSLDIDSGPVLQHVGVENETRKLKKSEQRMPTYVIAAKNLENNRIEGVYFEPVFKTEKVSIYQQVP